MPGEVGGCPGGGRWGQVGVDDPRALALGEQAEQEGGGGGGGGGEQQPGHREEEAGQDRDVEQVGLGGQGGRLEEESQAGGEQGKMARKWERGVEGDGGQQPGEGEDQVESHPGRKQISEMFKKNSPVLTFAGGQSAVAPVPPQRETFAVWGVGR